MQRGMLLVFLILIVAGLFYTACDNNSTEPSFESSIDMVVGLEPVSGTENSKITINKGTDQDIDSWFVFEIDEMQPNGFVSNGVVEGWCVEWNKPIQSDGTIHQNKMSYSTFGKDKWKPLNYFLSIKDQVKAEDPSITFREIQATIWSLVAEPKFDLNKLTNEELPARLKTSDGTPDFSKQKVLTLVNQVMKGVESFEYKKNKPVAVMHDMGNDKQVVITPETKSETAWAVNVVNDEVNDDISTCFLDEDVNDDIQGNAWGWTNGAFDGESEAGLTLLLYAGAAQCDLDKGTLVGTFSFTYVDGTLNFQVEMTETSEFTGELFELLALQIHVGNQILPDAPGGGPFDFTAAPGQFDEIFEFDPAVTTFEGTIDGLSGEIYVAVHTDVDGFDPDGD